jgi:transcriptional regulator with XRE-family HTH domain
VAVEEKRNINEDFGNRLREIIEKRKKETGQNLRAVAKDLDVSLGVLSDWQNGNKTPRGDSIAKLAKYFGVSADYLLGLTEAQTVDTDLRAVSDYTGLTENAILALKDSEMFECYDRSQKKILSDMIKKNGVNIIAIGNGTASRETELFAVELMKELNLNLQYIMRYLQ